MNVEHLREIFKGNIAKIVGKIKRGEPIGHDMYMNAYNIKDSTRILEEDLEKGEGNQETKPRLETIRKFGGYIDECAELHRCKARGCGQADAECDRLIDRVNAWA